MKLPPFWPSDPEVWFAQVEAYFTTRRITAQRTRFDHVVASLSPEVATEIRDLILRPPANQPYKVLREQLIKRTAASEQRRLQQLFHAEELGDRKPSQLLQRMQQLLGDRTEATEGTFLRELFLQRLPATVRMVLASTGTSATTLEQLADRADKVVEVAAPTIAATSASPQLPELLSEIEQLRTELRRLQTSVHTLSRQSRSRGRSSSRNQALSPSPGRASSDNPTVCWYHHKYGELARKCKPPCSHAAQSNDTASH